MFLKFILLLFDTQIAMFGVLIIERNIFGDYCLRAAGDRMFVKCRSVGNMLCIGVYMFMFHLFYSCMLVCKLSSARVSACALQVFTVAISTLISCHFVPMPNCLEFLYVVFVYLFIFYVDFVIKLARMFVNILSC